MAHVGGNGIDDRIHSRRLLAAAEHGTTDEGVSQIVKARLGVSTPSLPGELFP